MDAIKSWQAVLTELGGGVDNASAQSQARTPAAAHGGKDVFYTPAAPAQQATPVDAWHSILNTLTGNARTAAAAGRTVGSTHIPGSAARSPGRSPAAHSSPSCSGSPGMVRQLFASAPRSSKPEPNQSSNGSTPRTGLRQQQWQQEQQRPQQGSVSTLPALSTNPVQVLQSSPAARRLASAGLSEATKAGSPSTCRQLQDSPSAALPDTQQLADRLNTLRASAESVLQTVSQAAGSPAQCVGLSSASRHQNSNAAAHSVRGTTGATIQEPMPRKLFQSPVRPAGAAGAAAAARRGTVNRGAPASPLQRLLQEGRAVGAARASPVPPLQLSSLTLLPAGAALGPLQALQVPAGSAGASAGAGEADLGAGIAAGQQQGGQSLQVEQPLQQQLTGALSKVEQLLAAMSQRQQGSVGSRSSSLAGGSSVLPAQQAAADLVGAVERRQQDGAQLLKLQQQQAHHQAGQLQQQETLQQLLVQQQQLIQQLLPLIPQRDQVPQQADTPASLSGAAAAGDGAQGVPAAAAAAALNASAPSSDGSPAAVQQGSSMTLPAAEPQRATAAPGSSESHTVGDTSVTAAEAAVSSSRAGPPGTGNGGSSRRRRWELPLPGSSARLDAAVAQAPTPAADAPTDQAAAADSRGRFWSAGGSKSMSAGTGSASPRQNPARFASQGVQRDGSRGYSSSLAQQLGLPQVVRFRGAPVSSGGGDGQEGGARQSRPEAGGVSTSASSSCENDPPSSAVPEQLQAPRPVSQSSQACSGSSSDGGSAAAPSPPPPAAAAAAHDAEGIPSEQSSEPETPTAALPRVHTPGKPAAEVAGELSTPQLAHSAAAVMAVSESWREESNDTQGRWQALLAEWSAAEVDTWEPQRLTEPSAVMSPQPSHAASAGAPGLDPSQQTAGGSQHTLQQQQQLDSEEAVTHGQGGQSEQQQQQVTFVQLAGDFKSPRMLPAAVAVKQPEVHEACECADAAGEALEAEVSEASMFEPAAHLEQQQVQVPQPQQVEAAEPPPPHLPSCPDTTRKQLFFSAAELFTSVTEVSSGFSSARSGSSASSSSGAATASCHSSNSSSSTEGQHLTEGAAATLNQQQPAVAAAEHTHPAVAVQAGAEQAVSADSHHPDSPQQQQQQQASYEQQEEEGLERLNQLLHDLQGLQQRLHTIQLHTPRQQLQQAPARPDRVGGRPLAAVGTAAAAAAADGWAGSGLVAAAQMPAPGEPGQQLDEVLVTHSAVGGAAGTGQASATPASLHHPTAQGPAGPTAAASASQASATATGIALLKQRLQDSRAALQAIATPVRAEPAGGHPAGGHPAESHQQQQQQLPGSAGGRHSAAAGGRLSGAAAPSGGLSAAAAAPNSAGALGSAAWLTEEGCSWQTYLDRRRSSGTGVSARPGGWGAGSAESAAGTSRGHLVGSNPGGAHVQALVSKWRAAAAANNAVQLTPGAGPTPAGLDTAFTVGAEQQQQQQPAGASMLPSWQALPRQAHTATPAGARLGPAAGQHTAATGRAVTSQWLTTPPPPPAAAAPAAAVVWTSPMLQTPLGGTWQGSTGRSSTGGRGGAASSIRLTGGRTALSAGSGAGQRTSRLLPHTPASMLGGGTSSSGGRGVSRRASTPPSSGNLMRWAQQGSPTRQLRQQLQAAAQDFELQQQERQQQQQAALQSTPAAAALTSSMAVVDRTLAGLRSVSPAAAAAGGRTAATPLVAAAAGTQLTAAGWTFNPNSARFVGGQSSAAGGSHSAGGVVRGAAEVLAGTAAAAEAAQAGLLGARAQAAAARSVSPMQKLRRQQELLAAFNHRHPGQQAVAAVASGLRQQVTPLGSLRSMERHAQQW